MTNSSYENSSYNIYNYEDWFFFTLFILNVSYCVNAQSNSQNDIENFTYFEPIIIHQNPNKPNIFYKRFEEISINALDSVFEKEKFKYKISQKHNSNLKFAAKNKLISIFDARNKKITDIDFTSDLKSISQKSKNRYGIFFLIKTKSSTSINTTPISKIRLEVIIIDFVEKQSNLYGKSKNLSPKYNGGYTFNLIKDLDYVYKKINKL